MLKQPLIRKIIFMEFVLLICLEVVSSMKGYVNYAKHSIFAFTIDKGTAIYTIMRVVIRNEQIFTVEIKTRFLLNLKLLICHPGL